MMGKHFPAGVNGINGLESLEGIIDDANLNDQIREIGKKDSDACIRPLIYAYIQNKKPDMLKRIQTGDMKMTPEGNQFALAVRKAKAAGMKPGDKFKVGDKEYTLEDAMKMAGIGRGEKEEVQQILNKYRADFDKVKAGDSLMDQKNLYSELFSYYMDSGEMPYGTMKARDGDPEEWILDRLEDMGLLETMQKENNVNIDDEYRFRDWLKKTHNKDVHQLTPQEYIVVSKQYRDEKDKKESWHPNEESWEDLAQEIWKNNPGYHDEYKDWQEFAKSDDFQMEVDRLRSKFENKKEDLHKGTAKIEELVKSFYDYTTNKFPKGETAVITAVQKQYGDAAAKTAIETIKTLQSGKDMEIERIKQLAGYSTKK